MNTRKKFMAINASALDASRPPETREMVLSNLRSSLLTLEVHQALGDQSRHLLLRASPALPFTIMERPLTLRRTPRLKALVPARKAHAAPAPGSAHETSRKLPEDLHRKSRSSRSTATSVFFQNDVSLRLRRCNGTRPTKSEFAKTNAAVIAALKDYGAWMKTDLLPRSNGGLQNSAQTPSARSCSMTRWSTFPLDHLLEIAYADLQQESGTSFARIAREIDPQQKHRRRCSRNSPPSHPAPDQLLMAFQNQFSGLIAFINTHHIITIPSKVEPTLEETPPFERATTQASMDPPGPFETPLHQGILQRKPCRKRNWTPEHIAEHMAALQTSAPSPPPPCMRRTQATTCSFLWQPQFPVQGGARSSGLTPTSRAGLITANR